VSGDVYETVEELARRLGPLASRNAPLGARTTYRIGGTAALMVEAADEESLATCHQALAQLPDPVPVLVVGRGSNMLVAESGFPGLAIALGAGFQATEITGAGVRGGSVVRAGAAVGLQALARQTATAGLTGFEWAVGVPGSVGGAVRMNAGGHGSEMAGVLARARLFDLETGQAASREVAALGLGYRRSAVGPSEVVVGAEIILGPCDPGAALEKVAEVVRWRQVNQPGGSNAGSVFTNPAGDSAGRLIEASGLKGMRHGTASVSEKHANFFQADRQGSADDVKALVDEVRALVHERQGVDLVPELRMVGFPDIPFPIFVAGGSPSTSTRGLASGSGSRAPR
jgi:UDP-N-acetylmuramate dehydrogenase